MLREAAMVEMNHRRSGRDAYKRFTSIKDVRHTES
jgi:hypothetical protein